MTKKDKEKMEFLEVMKPRNMAQKWANDEAPTTVIAAEYNNDSESDKDDNEYDDVLLLNNNNDNDDQINISSLTKNITEVSASKQPCSSSSSDIDYLRSKIKSDFSDNSSDDDDDEEEEEGKVQIRKNKDISKGGKEVMTYAVSDDNSVNVYAPTNNTNTKHMEEEVEEAVSDDDDNKIYSVTNSSSSSSGRLFVRNLPYDCSEDDLTALFESFGTISQIHIPLDAVDSDTPAHAHASSSSDTAVKATDNQQKRGKGYGFVQFMIPEQATSALKSLDGTSFQGRLLHIIPAKDKYDTQHAVTTTAQAAEGATGSYMSEYKRAKEKERKSKAGLKDSWNAAYVRSDAVVASLAEK